MSNFITCMHMNSASPQLLVRKDTIVSILRQKVGSKEETVIGLINGTSYRVAEDIQYFRDAGVIE